MELKDYIKEKSLWRTLKESNKKIVIYGMGDGAQKLLDVLERKSLSCSGIFASDGFARHNVFNGFTVGTLADIEAQYDDFTILVAFATKLPDVISNIVSIASRHHLLIPDLNVCKDHREVFDEAFLESNYEALNKVFISLADEKSRMAFSSALNFKLSGKISYIKELSQYSSHDIMSTLNIKTYVDLGAYTGDTVTSFSNNHPELKKIFAFEPDPRNYRKLEENTKTLYEEKGIEIVPVNAAAWNCCTTRCFTSAGGKNSSLYGTFFNVKNKKNVDIKLVSPDSIIPQADFIKYDVEGAEKEALEGSQRLIRECFPALCVSVYHNNRDLFEIPLMIKEQNPDYKLRISFESTYFPIWDMCITATHK